jgi:hypothetical protein
MKNSKDTKDFFLSHSSIDKPFVKIIADELTKNDIKFWMDEWDIRPGENIVKEINSGLQNSSFVLVFLSKESVKSKWVEEEWTKKVYEEIDLGKTSVIPIIIDGFSPKKIPIILKGKKYLKINKKDYDEIGKLIQMVKKIRKEQVEKTEITKLKKIFKENKIIDNIINENRYREILERIESVSNWTITNKINLIKTEIDFAVEQDEIRNNEAKKRYESKPSEFNFWGTFALSGNKELKKTKHKIDHILNSKLDESEKYSQILSEINFLSNKKETEAKNHKDE